MDVSGFSPERHRADEVVRRLGLELLDQEGGYFRRTAQSETLRPDGRREWSLIYSLFTPESFSALHRLKSDEIWCFHAGDALESLRLGPDRAATWVTVGAERPQSVVAANIWQGTRLAAGGRWALVSCLVVPEFVWADFELGERGALIVAWPGEAEGIRQLTRVQPAAGKK